MTQQRVFGQAKIVISLVVLFLLVNSAFLSSISNLETNDETTKKEVFGPVVSLTPFKEVDEAIISKLTGKAAVYFKGVVEALNS